MTHNLPKIRQGLQILGTIVGLGILIYQMIKSFDQFEWNLITPYIGILSIISIVVCVIANGLLITSWKVILKEVGYSISLTNIMAGFSLAFVARYIPGTVWGYLSRGEWLKRHYGVSYSATSLGSIIETYAIVISAVIVISLLVLIPLNFSIILLILFFFLGASGGWALLNISLLIPRIRAFFRISEVWRFSFRKWLVVLLSYLGMWLLFGFALSLLMSSLNNNPVNPLSFLEITAYYALAWLIGFLVLFMPAGLGLRELILVLLLTNSFGVIHPTAVFISIGFRLQIIISELIWLSFGVIKQIISAMKRRLLPF